MQSRLDNTPTRPLPSPSTLPTSAFLSLLEAHNAGFEPKSAQEPTLSHLRISMHCDTPEGCRNTVSAYRVEAVPVKHGATGVRFFVLAEDGVIYHDSNADMSTRQPIE